MIRRTLKILLATILLFAANEVRAQVAFLTVGYTVTGVGQKGINAMVDRYNDSRPYLDKQMKHFGGMPGVTFGWGGGFGGFFTEMNYNFRRSTHSAEGVDATNELRVRQLRPKYDSFTWDIGFGGVDPNGESVVGFGMRLNVGNYRAKTRIFTAGEEKGDWTDIESGQLTAGVGPVFRLLISTENMKPFMIGFTLFYTYGLVKANVTGLDMSINNSTFDDDDPMFNNRLSTFGFGLNFGFVAGD